MVKKNQKRVYLICQAKITGDLEDAPSFAVVTFTQQTLTDIAKYQVFLKTMAKAKLDPYKIKEFNYAIRFMSPSDSFPLNKEEADLLVFLDDDAKKDWKASFDGTLKVESSSLKDLVDESNSPDCAMMSVKKDGVIFDAYVKHTSVLVDTGTIPNALLKKIAKKLEG